MFPPEPDNSLKLVLYSVMQKPLVELVLKTRIVQDLFPKYCAVDRKLLSIQRIDRTSLLLI
jgi:hypothetical protein